MKGWADSAWYGKRTAERTYEIATKQRNGSREVPAKESFVLERIHEDGAVSWAVSEGVEAEIKASQHARKILETLTANGGSMLRRDLIERTRLSGEKFSGAISVLKDANKVTTATVREPDARGRSQSQLRVSLAEGNGVQPSGEDARTGSDRRGQNPHLAGEDAGTGL